MAGHTLLILGAGFSKPFGGPLLDELFEPSFTSGSAADPDALETLRALSTEVIDEDGNQIGMEEAFSRLWEEQFTAPNSRTNGSVWSASDLIRELRKHLTSVASNVRLDHRNPIAGRLDDFLKKLVRSSRTLTIVTFNYDTLVEDCLSREGITYSYGNRRVLTFVDASREKALDKHAVDAEVLKLHGSVNWGVCRECTEAPIGADLINSFNGVFGLGRNKSCQFCDKKYLQSSIMPPVEAKGAGLQSLGPFWQRAQWAARRAREVIVIGYSLPPADTQAVAIVKGIVGPLKRPRIRIACGTRGAPRSYRAILKRYTDLGMRTEELLQRGLDL